MKQRFSSPTQLLTNPTYFFVIVGLFFGILFVYLIPPLNSPDEGKHFLRAYQVSQNNFVVDNNWNGTYGGFLPKSLDHTIDLLAAVPPGSLPLDIVSRQPGMPDLYEISTNQSEVKRYDFTATAVTPPVAYLPQAAGISLSRLLDAPPIVSFYLGRLLNLLVFIAIIALAISVTPIRKWAIVFIGLLPMLLSQASSLSPDALSFALISLLLGLVLYHRSTRSRLAISQILALLLVATLIALSKQLSIIFLPLLLLIPAPLLGSGWRALFIRALLIAVPLLLYSIWAFTISNIDIRADFVNGQNPAEQLAHLLKPGVAFNTLFNTYFFTAGDYSFRSLIGVFGLIDTPLALPHVLIGYVGLFVSLFTVQKEEESVRQKVWLSSFGERCLVLCVVASFFVAISFGLYILNSPVEYKTIYGLQGRYFLPILLVLIPLSLGLSRAILSLRDYRNYISAMIIYLQVASIVTIYHRYYVTW